MRGFIMWFMPDSMKAAAEAESRQWKSTCPNCGAVNSIWALGGLRYKAAGNPTKRIRCLACGRIGSHTFEKRS